MNKVKRLLGFIWIALGLAAGYYLLINQAIPKFYSNKADDLIPAIIYAFVLTPIIVGGILIFGKYCIQGEYDSV
jgi:hypothetical protein